MSDLARGANAPEIYDDQSTRPSAVHSDAQAVRSDAQAAESGTHPIARRPSYPPPSDSTTAVLVLWAFGEGLDRREVLLTREQADLVQTLGETGSFRIVPGLGRERELLTTADLMRLLDAKAILDLSEDLGLRPWARIGRAARGEPFQDGDDHGNR